jgi:hypothetical protein
MTDYDLPLLQADLEDLEKRGFVRKDATDCRSVDYRGVLSLVAPKAQAMAGQPALLAKAVIRVQTAWRARTARLELARRKRQAAADMDLIGGEIEALGAQDRSQRTKQATKGGKGSNRGPKDSKQKDTDKRRKESARTGRDR